MIKRFLLSPCCSLIAAFSDAQIKNRIYHEPYRLQVHFSPKEKWMNDPNGMVFYYKGFMFVFNTIQMILFGGNALGACGKNRT